MSIEALTALTEAARKLEGPEEFVRAERALSAARYAWWADKSRGKATCTQYVRRLFAAQLGERGVRRLTEPRIMMALRDKIKPIAVRVSGKYLVDVSDTNTAMIVNELNAILSKGRRAERVAEFVKLPLSL